MATTYVSSINNLEEVTFIGGNEFIFSFGVYDSNGSPIDLSATTPSWAMSYLGQQDSPVLVKAGVLSGSSPNEFSVTISGIDTIELSGVFIQQPIILDFDGGTYRPAQGRIIIIPAIQTT
jgi:hypothetical protein